jgi:hypothetical protein
MLCIYGTPFQWHRWEEHLDPLPVAGHNKYGIEEILGLRKKGHSHQFSVKCKNYLMNKHVWEPRRHLTNAKDILDKYCQEDEIAIWSLPILPRGHWNKQICCYKMKSPSLHIQQRKLFNPETGKFVPVDKEIGNTCNKLADKELFTVAKDVDPGEGVMSHLSSSNVPSIMTSLSAKPYLLALINL